MDSDTLWSDEKGNDKKKGEQEVNPQEKGKTVNENSTIHMERGRKAEKQKNMAEQITKTERKEGRGKKIGPPHGE